MTGFPVSIGAPVSDRGHVREPLDGSRIANPVVALNVEIELNGFSILGGGGGGIPGIVGNGQGINSATSTLISEKTVASSVKAGGICSQSCTVNGTVIGSNGLEGADIGPGSNVTGNSIGFDATIGLILSTMAGFSNNTMHANGHVEVFPPGHPTRLFDNVCDGAACP